MASTTAIDERTTILNAIRLEQRRAVATESAVLETAAAFADVDTETLTATFEQLRREGEIYTYPKEGKAVVRITDEVLA